MSAAPLPPGWRAASCPRCGASFACGAGAAAEAPCGCVAIRLSAERLAELRARYADCLCGACLQAFADSPGSPA